MTYALDPIIFYGVVAGNMDMVWIECEDGSFFSPTGRDGLTLEQLEQDERGGYLKRVCRHNLLVRINKHVGALCLGCKTMVKI